MPKARISLDNGTQVVIEGSSEELARILSLVGNRQTGLTSFQKNGTSRPSGKVAAAKRRGPRILIRQLIDDKFFDSPRKLREVRDKFQEMGYHYPVTSISPALTTLIRLRVLRRLKSGKVWSYVAD